MYIWQSQYQTNITGVTRLEQKHMYRGGDMQIYVQLVRQGQQKLPFFNGNLCPSMMRLFHLYRLSNMVKLPRFVNCFYIKYLIFIVPA